MLIAELQERYDITKKPLYSRAKALGLEFSKNSENKSFASTEQVEVLDQLHEHLKAGGTLKNFLPVTDVEVENTHDTPHDTRHDTTTRPTTQYQENNDISAIEVTTHDTGVVSTNGPADC